jgi:hypothetical protein
MSNWDSRKRVVGLVLHALIGGLMIAVGTPKLLGLAPPEQVERLGLTDSIRLIGAGEIIAGILLLIPRTLSLGILLTSAFWGGAICLHMSRGESYLLQSALLVASWVGAYLRYPAVLGDLWKNQNRSEPSGVANGVAGVVTTD